MRQLVLAFGLIVACGEEEAPPPPVVEEVVQADTGGDSEEVKDEAVEKPPRTEAQIAHELIIGGKAAEGLAAAQKLGDKALGDRLVELAVHSGATPPEGSDSVTAAAHKLVSGDAQGAFDTAKAAIGDGTGDAAVLLARAVRAGATIPEGLELPEAADSFLKWATSSDSRRARAHAAKADGVKGWRADVFRSEVAAAWGDKAIQGQADDALLASTEPRAKLAGLLNRCEALGVQGAEFGEMANEAHGLAMREGSAKDLAKATQFVVDAHRQSSSFADGLVATTAASEVMASAGLDTSEVLSFAAQFALWSGDPTTASTHAEAAMVAQPDADSVQYQQAAYLSGIAAWELGRNDALDKAASLARGSQKDALKALTALAKGDTETARLQFPPSGLSDVDGAYIYEWAALSDPAGAVKWYDKAIKHADKSGIAALRLRTRLSKESELRKYNRNAAAAARRDIAGKINGGNNLQTELAVRSQLSGVPVPMPAGGPAGSELWAAMAEKRMPNKVEGAVWEGLLHWARGRAAANAGRLEGHDGHFPAALGKLPLHHMGRLDLGTTVDGSEGIALETDVALLKEVGGETAIGLALSAHDVGHRIDTMSLDLSQGMQPLYGVSDDAREALMSAVSKARADVLNWQLGNGDFPAASIEAVTAAETAAAESSPAFKSMLPTNGSTAQQLLNGFGRGAVVSYRAAHGKVQAIALSRVGTSVKEVGSTAKIFGLANQYREALAVSAQDKKTKTDHSAGHFLREKILDPFIGDLTGVGRYAIIAPPELLQFPLTAMPEQAEGLRWLADIRQVTGSPTVATLQRKLRDVDAETYKLDYLAFGADAPPPQENELTDFEAPDELKICGRYFRSGFDEVLVGKAATLETWKAKAENARYIHIADIGPAMNGGFQLADGALSLDEIRNTRLHAELVVITGRTTTEQQLRRARAFMDAGARWVIVSGWFVPDRTRVKYLSNIFDSMNQERPPVRAMSEGRNALFRDALMGVDLDDPALWGGLTLFGKP